MTTAILIPVERPARIMAIANEIAATVHPLTPVLWACTEGSECAAILEFWREDFTCDEGGSWGVRLNRLFTHTDAEYLFLGADDVRFHPGWHDAAMARMQQVDGVVAVNDLWNPRGTLALVSRRYLLEEGGTVDGTGAIIHEGYRHCFSETELFETAASRSRFAYCAESIVEHLHPAAGKSEWDEVYKIGTDNWDHDEALYLSRRHLWA